MPGEERRPRFSHTKIQKFEIFGADVWTSSVKAALGGSAFPSAGTLSRLAVLGDYQWPKLNSIFRPTLCCLSKKNAIGVLKQISDSSEKILAKSGATEGVAYKRVF